MSIKLLSEIDADIEWRTAELSSIQTLPVRYRLRDRDESIYLKSSILMIYAIWEGFVVKSLTAIVRYINSLELNSSQLNDALLTHMLDGHVQFHHGRVKFEQKKVQVLKIVSVLDDKVQVPAQLDTRSNVNFDVANELFERLCLDKLENKYKSPLSKLLKFRNSIAHGENSLPVNLGIVNEFVRLVQEMMDYVRDRLESYLELQLYKKVPLY